MATTPTATPTPRQHKQRRDMEHRMHFQIVRQIKLVGNTAKPFNDAERHTTAVTDASHSLCFTSSMVSCTMMWAVCWIIVGCTEAEPSSPSASFWCAGKAHRLSTIRGNLSPLWPTVLGLCRSTVTSVLLQVVTLMCIHLARARRPPLQVLPRLPLPNLKGLMARSRCAALAAAAADHVLPQLYFHC